MIEKIYRKDVPRVLNNPKYWEHSFLPISKHRLLAHYENPCCSDEDLVLLLAYLEDELVGYIGVFSDNVYPDKIQQKIGWLSTWWVHPKTKGLGIGRDLFQTMYQSLNGNIGVSQFTPSAKRIYEKSGYFRTLKLNKGYKFVYRSNLDVVLPLMNSKFKKIRGLLSGIDAIINIFISIKNIIQSISNNKKLQNIKLSYTNFIDEELEKFIQQESANHLSKKSAKFFQWLKAYHWVQEAPLIGLSDTGNYQFSMNATKFNLYFVKITSKNKIIGFIVLQRKNTLIKLLFAYYEDQNVSIVARVVLQHALKLRVKELVSYDTAINNTLKKSPTYIYKRKKLKESIISKNIRINDLDSHVLNFGDGDCCFA